MGFRSRRSSTPDAPPIVYLGQTLELDNLTGGEIAIVLGELVIMNMDEPPEEGSGNLIHVPQPTRQSRRKDFSLAALRSPARSLYASIHPDLAQQMDGQPHDTRFVLAVDAMFALASRHSRTETLLICNGYHAADETYFDLYLFRHGQLVRTDEANIKPADHPRYPFEVKQQLDELLSDYPEARILWTTPLSPLELPGYDLEYVGPEIYLGKFPSLTHDGRTTPPSPKIPAIATAGVIALCIGTGAYDAAVLSKKRDTYDTLTQQNTATPPLALEILQARANWQRETDGIGTDRIISPAANLLSALATNSDLRITSLSLTTQRGSETTTPPVPQSAETTPLSVTLTMPVRSSESVTDQAQPIVAALNQQTGMKLIVKPQGLTATQDGRLRVIVGTDGQ